MSSHAAERIPWEIPETYRECVETADRAASELAGVVRRHRGALLIPLEDVEFLARRVAQLVAVAHDSLPPDVI